jgi:PAS domain S-box-containing protein
MAQDKNKTKAQLITETEELRQRLAKLDGADRDLKRAEEALRKREEELDVIFDSVPAMIFYKDRTNRHIRVNQAFVNAMGLSRGEIEGKTAFDLFPGQAEDYWRDDKEVMSTGVPKTNITEPLETPQGKRWVRTDKLPYRDEDGDIIGIIGFAVDITELKRVEEALRDSEEALRAVLDSTADGILAVDANGRVSFANKRFAQMWHIPPDLMETGDDEELLGFVVDQLTDPEGFLAKVRELYQSFRDGFDTLHFHDGRVFERYSRPLVKENKLPGRVWTFRDVTARKRPEGK